MLGLGPPVEPAAPAASSTTESSSEDSYDWSQTDQLNPEVINPRHVGLRDVIKSGFYDVDSDELIRGMTISATDKVVDVGCGDAAALRFCADRNADIIGVDIHPETVAAAEQFLGQRGQGLREFHVAAAESLPIDSDIATRVVCQEVLEHVVDPSMALAEMYRVGKPGAMFLITVPDALQEHLQEVVAPKSYFEPPNHIRIIERDELRDLVSGAGLEIISHTSTGFFWSIWYALFWSRGVDIDNPDDPVLNHWTAAWDALLNSDNGDAVKAQLDEFMGKSQVIVARKPAGDDAE
jgi:SAM-dependent methyltransferase